MSETMSAEAKALHAMLAGDFEDADRVLGTFLRHELTELMSACVSLNDHASQALSKLPDARRRSS